jgi:hypothetical protein
MESVAGLGWNTHMHPGRAIVKEIPLGPPYNLSEKITLTKFVKAIF